jgi:L-ascorbate metabolism protein UlaG (beta-lactamase superfamily)
VASDPTPNANENTNPPPATGVTITYLHNDGVMISDGTRKVLIDALIDEFAAPPQAAGPNSAWVQLDATELDKLNNAQAPYDGADLILITHDHGDHYSSAAINSHLSNNTTVRVIGPPQVTGGLNGAQIANVSPALGSSETVTENGVQVEVLHLRHFDAFGFDFSGVENYGYLITIGGKNILHLGDVEMTVENLQNFGLAAKGIDVVLIPTFNTDAHLTTAHRDALNDQIQPANIIALHLLSDQVENIRQQVNTLYPGATMFTTPLETAIFN